MSEANIDYLNNTVRIRIAPSPIDRVGIFAIRDIQKGTKLYADNAPVLYKISYSSFNKFLPEVRQLLLERWPQIVNGSAFLYPDSRLLAYMNHDDEPNYDAVSDTTLKDISAGSEVLEDYRKIEGYEKVYPFLIHTKGLDDLSVV